MNSTYSTCRITLKYYQHYSFAKKINTQTVCTERRIHHLTKKYNENDKSTPVVNFTNMRYYLLSAFTCANALALNLFYTNNQHL